MTCPGGASLKPEATSVRPSGSSTWVGIPAPLGSVGPRELGPGLRLGVEDDRHVQPRPVVVLVARLLAVGERASDHEPDGIRGRETLVAREGFAEPSLRRAIAAALHQHGPDLEVAGGDIPLLERVVGILAARSSAIFIPLLVDGERGVEIAAVGEEESVHAVDDREVAAGVGVVGQRRDRFLGEPLGASVDRRRRSPARRASRAAWPSWCKRSARRGGTRDRRVWRKNPSTSVDVGRALLDRA